MFWISYSRKGFLFNFETDQGRIEIIGTITVWYYLFKYVSVHSVTLHSRDGFTRDLRGNRELYDLLGVGHRIGLNNLIKARYDYEANGSIGNFEDYSESTLKLVLIGLVKGFAMFFLIVLALDLVGIINLF